MPYKISALKKIIESKIVRKNRLVKNMVKNVQKGKKKNYFCQNYYHPSRERPVLRVIYFNDIHDRELIADKLVRVRASVCLSFLSEI